MNIDIIIFNTLNNLAENWFLVDLFFYFTAKILPYFLLLPFFYLFFKDYKKNLFLVGEALFAAFFARYVVCELIRYIVPRERPFNILEESKLLLPLTENASLPSGHVSFLFALATVAFFYNKKLGGVLLGLSFLVGISRVYAGVHWPSDILAGVLVGILCGFFIYHISLFLKKRWL